MIDLPALLVLAADAADGADEATDPLADVNAMEGLVQVVIVLVAICLLFWVLIRFVLPRLARLAGGRGHGVGGGRVIRIVDRCPLEPRRTLFLVEVAGRYLLVGSSEGSITKLGGEDLDEAELRKALDAPPRRTFKSLLNVVGGRKGEQSESKTAE